MHFKLLSFSLNTTEKNVQCKILNYPYQPHTKVDIIITLGPCTVGLGNLFSQ